jgi:probable addiction module antidote protein
MRKRTGKTIKNGKNHPPGRLHEEGVIEWLRENADHQREYLKVSLEENFDMPGAILMAIREVAIARGFESFAKDAGLSKKALYKILSESMKSKPRFETVVQLIHAMGLRFTLEPLPRKSRAG